MKHAANIGGALLFLAVLVVLGWNQLPREETAAPVPPPTSTAVTTTTTATTTLPPPTTSTTSTTIPPLPEIHPVSIEGPLGADSPQALVAISAQETWVIMNTDTAGPNLIGHLVDGQWTYYQTTESRWGTFGLAAAPDGTIWAATEVGVFSFDGRHWTRRSPDPTSGVAVGADGTVWIGGRRQGRGGPADPRLWLARWNGVAWERVDPRPDTTPESSTGTRITTMPDGSAWIAQRPGYWVEDDLMHYDGATMEVVDIPGIPDPTPDNNMPAIRVFEVEATPGGDLWVAGYVTADPGRGVLARFDGAAWALYDWPPPLPVEPPVEADLSAGPNGTMWLASGGGLWSFDGSAWLGHVEGTAVRNVDVAPDGTVWYSDGTGIHALQTP